MQIPVPLCLSAYLKHYLLLSVKVGEQKKYRLFSNGHTGMVLLLNGKNNTKINNEKVASTFIFGQLTSFLDFEFSDDIKILVVVFQPYGLSKLTNIPGSEMQNLLLDTEFIFGKSMTALCEILSEQLDTVNLFRELNLHLEQLFKKQNRKITTILPNIIRHIQEKKGQISLVKLRAEQNIHERKLQRMFLEQIGITPKKFIQIVKLHSFLGFIKGKALTHTKAAYAAGYYDQAHLIKDFKAFTGLTPSAYSKSNFLAVNLVKITH